MILDAVGTLTPAQLAHGELDPVLQEAMPLDDIVRAYEIVDARRKVENLVVRP
ncbi:hypothetical protein AA0Z99_01660 [Agrococcus sp. 1P02AA]|uniref:hypothetical protein n=1 Tax=Agrococcus sp. 1P02AA TaxID=3132259 RepID=UPI0039A61006